MTIKAKGMVQLEGVTYRIARLGAGSYSVIRVLDDQEVGAFTTAPRLGFEARLIAPELLREVARLAIHTAKTSYVGFVAPTAQSDIGGNVLPKPSSVPPPLTSH
jgi:hypothetical protein